MNSDALFALFDGIMFAVGLYCLYSWWLMRFKGEIHDNRMTIPADYSVGGCRDKNAYMRFMGPRILVFSLMCVVFGGINLLSHAVPVPGAVQFICIAVLFLNLMWFALVIRKSIQLYWPPRIS